jgi:hypothetical protein
MNARGKCQWGGKSIYAKVESSVFIGVINRRDCISGQNYRGFAAVRITSGDR